ncbi:hypothetical protein GLV98_02480 [Halobacillus litoralis]|uniref:DUF4181 domain-containing protein n=1 Tax=Halobacillus litoralis TaxID=45668 RepID=A0A845DY38_9BACI|nr:hypothetical protein [Halobacillus litoralis]MYL48327.1 hypothetical protein [Halobacillus litoralis]
MNKTWRWLGHILFGAAVLIFLFMLFTDLPFRTEWGWIFLAPSVVITRVGDMCETGKKVEPLITITLCILIFSLSLYGLLFI